EPVAFGWLPFLAAWLVPVAGFFLLSLAVGERHWLLAAVAALALALGLWAYGRYSVQALVADQNATAKAVAAHLAAETERDRALLAELGSPGGAALDASHWDVDTLRQPRAENPAALKVVAASRITRTLATLGVLGLALLAFVGFGFAYRTG